MPVAMLLMQLLALALPLVPFLHADLLVAVAKDHELGRQVWRLQHGTLEQKLSAAEYVGRNRIRAAAPLMVRVLLQATEESQVSLRQ
jgi:hypothetical protein